MYSIDLISNIYSLIFVNQEACLQFYRDAPDRTNFDENWSEELTILDKLKASLKSSLQSEDDIVIIDLIDTLSNTIKVKTKLDLTDVKSPEESIEPEPQNNLKEIPCM